MMNGMEEGNDEGSVRRAGLIRAKYRAQTRLQREESVVRTFAVSPQTAHFANFSTFSRSVVSRSAPHSRVVLDP